MSQSRTSSESSRLQRLRAGGRALGGNLEGHGTRADPLVATVLLAFWSFTLAQYLPIQINATSAFVRLDSAHLAAGPLGFMLLGLAGTGFAWGYLTRRVWGYVGSIGMTGLWVAPVGVTPRLFLFVVFWYLLVINEHVL
jgi:hypothetical protein